MASLQRRKELIAKFEPLGEIGAKWVERLKESKCPMCGNEIKPDEFRDELSLKEFELSHLCQKCQDDVFTVL